MVVAAVAVAPVMGVPGWPVLTSLEPRQEQSANTRLLVWEWTIDLANRNPAGAGFISYLGNRFVTAQKAGDR